MGKRWVVELTQEEPQQLEQLIKKGKVAGYKIRHAHLLLKADEGEHGPSWPDRRIADVFNVSESTVRNLVEKGFEAALEREKQTRPAPHLCRNLRSLCIFQRLNHSSQSKNRR